MNRKHILKSLQDNARWLASHDRDNSNPNNDWRAQDIMIGSAEILGQCHQTMAGWIDERPYGRPVLGRLQRSWANRHPCRPIVGGSEVRSLSDVEGCAELECFPAKF